MSYPLVRIRRYRLDAFALRCGLHPDLVHRYVALGLVEAHPDASGELWFDPAELPRIARINRLHDELSLNYAAIGLVLDLLEEIERLHAQARAASGVDSAKWRLRPGGRSTVDPQ